MHLRIGMLGGLEVRAGDGPPLSLPSRRAQALVACLAHRPGRERNREELAALIWSDRPPARARHSLRQALVSLKHALPEPCARALAVTRGAVALRAEIVDVDVGEFERLARSDEAAALERAARLYRGDFLTGLDVGEGLFEEWLMAERERLRELALASLTRLLAHHLRRGDVDRALPAALRALAIDPLQEAVHRALMRLFARQGRRAAALQQYQVCVDLLRRDLQVAPEPETRRLYEQILQGQPAAVEAETGSAGRPTPGPAPAAARRRRSAEPALVGRDREAAAIRRALDQACRGEARAIVLTGEAGIGKSRLVEEAAAIARGAGALVLAGRCYESLQALPFGPWVDALRSSGTAAAGLCDGLSDVWRFELARLLPEIGPPGLALSTAPENAVRLFEALVALVEHLSRSRPLLLALEDLHWADDMTLRLLAFVARRLGRSRVALVATARDEEDAAHAPSLQQVLAEVRDRPHVVHLPLEPLTESDTLALVRALAAAADGAALDALARRIWSASEGNPFVIVEMMDAAHVPDRAGGEALALPQRVRDATQRRFARLGPPAASIVAAAAIIGREFEFGLLERAVGIGARATAEGVEELVRSRILRGSGELLAFTHDRTREVAYDRLVPATRRALHGAVAQAIEAESPGAADPAACHARLAFHYSRAGDAPNAIRYLTRFAEAAARSYAHDDALRGLGEATALVDHLPRDAAPAALVDLVCRRVGSLVLIGRGIEARDLLVQHRDLADALADRALTGRFYAWLAFVYNGIDDHEATVAAAERALAEAAPLDDQATMGRALYVLSFDAFWHGTPTAGVDYALRAIPLLAPLDQRFWLAASRWSLGLNWMVTGDLELALPALEQAEREAADCGDLMLQICAAATRAVVLAQLGDPAAAAVGEENVRRARNPWAMATALAFLGAVYVEQGDGARAIDVLERALGALGDVHFPRLRVWFSAWLSDAYRLGGRPQAARALAAANLEPAAAIGYRWALGHLQRTLAAVAIDQGDVVEGRARLAEALATYAAVQSRRFLARTERDLAAITGAGRPAPAAAPAPFPEV